MIYHIKRTYSRKVVMSKILLFLFLSVFPLSGQNWTYIEKNKTDHETTYIGYTIKRVYIVTSSADEIVPCGRCRQLLSEFIDSSVKIYTRGNNKNVYRYLIDELLPRKFSL